MFEDFDSTEFPASWAESAHLPGRKQAEETGGYVYIICWVDGGQEVPFYVGQTRRLRDRMDDYRGKQFAASTDFRVGEAICYLQKEKKFQIVVKYKQFENHKAEEYKTIKDLQTSGVRLLNDLVSYDYRRAQKQDEEETVRKFCEVLIRSKLR